MNSKFCLVYKYTSEEFYFRMLAHYSWCESSKHWPDASVFGNDSSA